MKRLFPLPKQEGIFLIAVLIYCIVLSFIPPPPHLAA